MSLRRIAGLWGPVAACLAVLFYLSSQRHPPGADLAWDKLAHAAAYCVLGILVLRAFHGRLGALVAKPSLWSMLFTVGYGASDEIHQSFVPGRDASIHDVLADAVGFALAALLVFTRYNLFSRPSRAADRGEA